MKCKTIAFIPVRGGSKSIPKKNITLFAGKPLVYWCLLAAQMTPGIDAIVVSTDSKEIEDTVAGFGFSKVSIFRRSRLTATDTASTESAMLEFAQKAKFKTMVLMQATSPLVTPRDLTLALRCYARGRYDSMLSVVRQKRFIWSRKPRQGAVPVNYDVANRPRRQQFDGFLVENGAFYITSRDGLLQSKKRLNGKIGLYEMPEYTYTELDEPSDWSVVEALIKNTKWHYIGQWVKSIRVLAVDLDGVLTDGGVYYSKQGEALLKFSRIDGKGIEIWKRHGNPLWVISSQESAAALKRCQDLGIRDCYLGVKDKLSLVKQLAFKHHLQQEEICFVGDDIQDIPVLQWVGFAGAPANALGEVKKTAHYVCEKQGGNGAVREIADLILRYQKDGGIDEAGN